MPDNNNEEFVSEALIPVPGSADPAAMSRGEPGLPNQFSWRDQQYTIKGIISKWKTSNPCHHGGGEMYLRRHWYKIVTTPQMIMTIYCDRQAKLAKKPKARWWIYTVEKVGEL